MNFRSIRPAPISISEFPIPALEPSFICNKVPAFIHSTPNLEIVRLELFWMAGSKDASTPFLANLAAEMLFSGNDEISEEEIIKKLDYYGVSYSMDTGVSTTSLSIRFHKKHSDIVIPWVLNNVRTVSYPVFEVENAIMVRTAGIERQQQTPKYWSNRLSLESLYGLENPLSRFGEIEQLEKITSDQLNEFRKTHLNIGSAMIFLSGDTDESTVSIIESIISEDNSSLFTPNPKTSCDYSSINGKILKKGLPNASQVSLQMVKHIIPESQRERHVLTLLNLVLGGYFGSRLMQELREKQGLTYGIGSYFKPAFDDYTWIISGEMNSENMEKTLVAIDSILIDLKTNLIDLEELTKLKQYYSGVFRSGFDGPFALSGKVQSNIMKHQDAKYYATVLPEIWSINSEEILRCANKYLTDNSFVIALAGNI
jgi:zinc protease